MTTTFRGGAFVIDSLPAGMYRFDVQGALTDSTNVVIIVPGIPFTDFTIAATPGAIVRGVVTSPDSQPVPNADVMFYDAAGHFSALTTSDGKGSYVTQPLKPGTYASYVENGVFARTSVGNITVVAGETTLNAQRTAILF